MYYAVALVIERLGASRYLFEEIDLDLLVRVHDATEDLHRFQASLAAIADLYRGDTEAESGRTR
ncbi:hypothetical protein [Amycolatopsis sp. NPDC004378]